MRRFLIKNGKIIDGTGNPWFKADILIDNDTIAEIAPRIEQSDVEEVIDASGLIVCPGFIDIHTHSDRTILQSRGENVLTQGVTTHVVGNCGFSMTPINTELADDEIYDMFKSMLTFDDKFEFYNSLTEYLRILKQNGIPINVAPLVGHSMIRILVLGVDNRAPNINELEEMKKILRSSMEQGAFGMSTGLDYPPGSFAKTDEIIELCKVVKEYEGIYTTHFRGFSSGLVRATKEAVKIARSGISVQISHFKPFGFWPGNIRKACKVVERAREEGLEITFDVFPHASNYTFLFALVPPWVYLSNDKIDIPSAIETLIKSKKDEELRNRILREMSTIAASLLNIKEDKDWIKVFINAPNNEEYNGKHVYQISTEKHKDPREVIIDILIDQNGAVNATYLSITEEDNIVTIVHPLSMIASDGQIIPEKSDAFPNPYCYGTFTQVLGKYVREKKLLTLHDAVRKMTSFPAQKLGLKNRGLLKEGFWADITIFDPDKIKDNATYENPRLHSEGIEFVFVNGVLAYNRGNFTGAKSGKPLSRRAQ
ncbi:MAG: N-acyl-D-amino-acid deacylase family protein [Promethearchaeota archaeon]